MNIGLEDSEYLLQLQDIGPNNLNMHTCNREGSISCHDDSYIDKNPTFRHVLSLSRSILRNSMTRIRTIFLGTKTSIQTIIRAVSMFLLLIM